MVKINRLNLSGFKAHADFEVELSNINIITGKNNTGKTSILEAIDLLFNPGNIREFSDNVDKLINVGMEEAVISSEFSGVGGQTRLSEYSDEGVDSRTMKLTHPDPDDVRDYLIEVLVEQIRRIASRDNIFIVEDDRYIFSPEFRSELENITEDEAIELLDNEILGAFVENAVIVEIGGDQYPYLYMGDEYDDLTENLALNVSEEILQQSDEDDYQEDRAFILSQLFRRAVIGRYGRSVFINEPASIGYVNYVRTLDLQEKNIQNFDNWAVTLSDIEDHLKEHEILESITDFDTDQLVFGTGDDKYSIPYDFMGDGFKLVVGLLWELYRKDRSKDVILLEEPENHMHPGYIREIVRFIVEISRNRNIQFIITTHNIDLINEFLEVHDQQNLEFLEEEFELIHIEDQLPQILDFEVAESDMNELHIDLRGMK